MLIYSFHVVNAMIHSNRLRCQFRSYSTLFTELRKKQFESHGRAFAGDVNDSKFTTKLSDLNLPELEEFLFRRFLSEKRATHSQLNSKYKSWSFTPHNGINFEKHQIDQVCERLLELCSSDTHGALSVLRCLTQLPSRLRPDSNVLSFIFDKLILHTNNMNFMDLSRLANAAASLTSNKLTMNDPEFQILQKTTISIHSRLLYLFNEDLESISTDIRSLPKMCSAVAKCYDQIIAHNNQIYDFPTLLRQSLLHELFWNLPSKPDDVSKVAFFNGKTIKIPLFAQRKSPQTAKLPIEVNDHLAVQIAEKISKEVLMRHEEFNIRLMADIFCSNVRVSIRAALQIGMLLNENLETAFEQGASKSYGSILSSVSPGSALRCASAALFIMQRDIGVFEFTGERRNLWHVVVGGLERSMEERKLDEEREMVMQRALKSRDIPYKASINLQMIRSKIHKDIK